MSFVGLHCADCQELSVFVHHDILKPSGTQHELYQRASAQRWSTRIGEADRAGFPDRRRACIATQDYPERGDYRADGERCARLHHAEVPRLTCSSLSGCICCTLRGDLLEEIANIAAKGGIDYLLIESCEFALLLSRLTGG